MPEKKPKVTLKGKSRRQLTTAVATARHAAKVARKDKKRAEIERDEALQKHQALKKGLGDIYRQLTELMK